MAEDALVVARVSCLLVAGQARCPHYHIIRFRFSAVAGLPKNIRVSRHLSPTSPFAGFSRTSMFSIPLLVSEAFAMLVIAVQIAALDPLMVTCASTIMVFLRGSA